MLRLVNVVHRRLLVGILISMVSVLNLNEKKGLGRVYLHRDTDFWWQYKSLKLIATDTGGRIRATDTD